MFQLFATGASDTGGKNYFRCCGYLWQFVSGINDTCDTGVKICCRRSLYWLTLVVHLNLQISPRILKKIQNDPTVMFRGLGEDDKKT
jgi:hypothetical protein